MTPLRISPANIISISRVPIGIAFLVTYNIENKSLLLCSLIILIIAQVSDHIDGYVARIYNSVSNTGWLFDSYGDRAIYTAAILAYQRELGVIDIVVLIFLLQEIAYYAVRVAVGDFRKFYPRFRTQILIHAGLVRTWIFFGCIAPFYDIYVREFVNLFVFLSTIYGFYKLYYVTLLAQGLAGRVSE